MKKLFLSMLACMMALGVMAQDGVFTVKGTFEAVGDSVHIFLSQDFEQGVCHAVTGQMIEERFELKDVNMVTIGRWFTGRTSLEDGDITLPAIPGETLVVTWDENGEPCLGGSQFYVDYNVAWKTVEPINREGMAFSNELIQKMKAGVPEEELMDLYQQKVPVLLKQLSDAVMGYVKVHPDQDAAAALIAQLPEETQYLEPAIALLTERARNSVAANHIWDILFF